MKCFIVIFLSLLITNISFGQSKDTTCFRPSSQQILVLCGYVKGQVRDEDENSRYNFLWQKLIEQMSCVDYLNDNPETVKRKVQIWWNKYHDDCKCSRSDFVLTNGNILKFAVQNTFEEFIFSVIKDYKLNLNFIAPADGETALDFAKDEYERIYKLNPDHPRTKNLQKIIKLLRDNGALYKSELK